MQRRAALERLLDEQDADAVLISHRAHIRWLTGFSGSSGVVLAGRTGTVLVTDARYSIQAANESDVSRIVVANGDIYDRLLQEDLLAPDTSVLVQPEYLSAIELDKMRASRPDLKAITREGLFRRAVAMKEDPELDLIRRAQSLSEEVLDYLVGWIKPGLKEFEVAAEIVCQHLRRGADRMAFDPIVASGSNSAMPHARPSDRELKNHDVLLLDFGCVWRGYACDMTRTFIIGSADDRIRHVYGVVAEAQQRAIDSARAGMTAGDLDSAARSVIEEAGFGPNFSHSLGHGVGLEVHEWPRISARSNERLPMNAVITLEPGVYLPGEFGIRIEDMVVLGPDGCINLTGASKTLTEL